MAKFQNHNHKLKWYEHEVAEDPEAWYAAGYGSLGFFMRQSAPTQIIKPDVIGEKFQSEGWYGPSNSHVTSANSYMTSQSPSNTTTSTYGNVGTAPGSPYSGCWAALKSGSFCESISYSTGNVTSWGYYNNSSSSKFNVVTGQKRFFDMRLQMNGTPHPGTTTDGDIPVMGMVCCNMGNQVRGVVMVIFTGMFGNDNLSQWVNADKAVYGVIWDRATDSYIFIPSSGSTTSTLRFSNSPYAGSSRWTQNNSASGDDGAWGIPISGKWDGNSPGPYGYNNAGYGVGNWNAGDSSTNSTYLYWGSTAGTSPTHAVYVF